jgi:hypothetical protein
MVPRQRGQQAGCAERQEVGPARATQGGGQTSTMRHNGMRRTRARTRMVVSKIWLARANSGGNQNRGGPPSVQPEPAEDASRQPKRRAGGISRVCKPGSLAAWSFHPLLMGGSGTSRAGFDKGVAT